MGAPAGSAMLAALEEAWREVQARHPETPDVVMVISSGSPVGRETMMTLGHFAGGRWRSRADKSLYGEIMVSGEGLAREPREVLATVLHEAAHAIAKVREVKDTSRAGAYHNAKFKAIAEELGLNIAHDKRIGWSVTAMPESTADAYGPTVAALGRALIAYRHGEPRADKDKKASTKNGVVLVCKGPECGGRQFRISATAWGAGPIMCGPDGTPFDMEESEGDDE